MKAVAYMLDTSIWNKFAKDGVAEYAIGGPTVELLFKSYNATHQTSYVAGATSNTGYQIKKQASDSWSYEISSMLKTEKPYVISDKTNASGMWLASPSVGSSGYVMDVGCRGGVNGSSYFSLSVGFRPLVCLKSDIHLEKSEDGNSYTIVEQ